MIRAQIGTWFAPVVPFCTRTLVYLRCAVRHRQVWPRIERRRACGVTEDAPGLLVLQRKVG